MLLMQFIISKKVMKRGDLIYFNYLYVGLLGIASYSLVITIISGARWLFKPHTIGATIVGLLLYLLFVSISAYGVITVLGYLHKG